MKLRLDPHTRRKALRSALALVLGLALFNLVLGDMGLVESWRKRRAVARLREDVVTAQASIDGLKADIVALRKDPFRIEAIAREQLNLARPGEILFLFTPEAPGK
ncbi:MAG TPA: septum formation initiator family protein [Candidatus Polarisedimenticolia bacterium]|jgi:cell division protein FtsB|nr:septum formation initiator family protein [Candidatus Polarisedimenticolia bacterium]